MGENSRIEWTDHTFNPWFGCQKVSPGCDHCYAEAMMDHRYGKVQWGPHGERKRTSAANWKKPLQWARAARATGKRPRVFCASLADVFDNQVPPAWRFDLFALIECTPELDWLLLTKRPENIRKMAPIFWQQPVLTNVWLGTTCEDQEHYLRRFHFISEIPVPVRFISYEPALGPLAIGLAPPVRAPDWIICGGESGRGARLMEPWWARNVRDDCELSGIAFFMKQMTAKAPIPDDLMVRQFPERVSHAAEIRQKQASVCKQYPGTDAQLQTQRQDRDIDAGIAGQGE
jgi:protein gp37